MPPSASHRLALLAAAIALLAFASGCAGSAPPSDVEGTGEVVRAQFERYPEAYRLTLNDDVVVRVAYPSEVIRWSWAAVITHLPSQSSIELDLKGELLRSHFQSSAGEAALRSVLDDDAMMASVRRSLALIGDGVVFEDDAPP